MIKYINWIKVRVVFKLQITMCSYQLYLHKQCTSMPKIINTDTSSVMNTSYLDHDWHHSSFYENL